jgi:hypothetical protein
MSTHSHSVTPSIRHGSAAFAAAVAMTAAIAVGAVVFSQHPATDQAPSPPHVSIAPRGGGALSPEHAGHVQLGLP